jgi:hypothetical protein
MPTIYLNGGSPNYTGAIVTNATDLLALIKLTLEDAGWVTITYDPGVNLFARGTALINAHSCWVEFAVSGTTLTLRGWLEEEKTNGSPDAIHTHSFVDGGENRLWLTADEESGVLCIFDSNGQCAGTHFGFLNRVDKGDPWAWMIGRVRSDGLNFAYSAKAKNNDANWALLGDAFYASSQFNVVSQTIPLTTFDLVCRGKPGGTSSSLTHYSGSNASNAFYQAHEGRKNYNGQAFIDPYCYMEGLSSSSSYSGSPSLYLRGFVKHCFCGVASEPAAGQSIDPITGNRILSTGGTRWQGMRVL